MTPEQIKISAQLESFEKYILVMRPDEMQAYKKAVANNRRFQPTKAQVSGWERALQQIMKRRRSRYSIN